MIHRAASGRAVLFCVLTSALLLASCEDPVAVEVPGPCSNAGALPVPGTITRTFDPDGCTLLNLERRPFTGSETGGTFRYDRFTLVVPANGVATIEWGQPTLPGLGIRLYDEEGSVVALNGAGWHLMNPSMTSTRTFQVVVIETQAGATGESLGEVTGDYRLSVSRGEYGEPVEGTFALQTIGTDRLPANIWTTSYSITALSGRVTLKDDWTWEAALEKTYDVNYPSWTDTYRGTYSRAGDSLALETEDAWLQVGRVAGPDTVILKGYQRHDVVDYVYQRVP